MQQRIINMLAGNESNSKQVNIAFSFSPFIDYLQQHVADAEGAKRNLYEATLEKFKSAGCDKCEIKPTELSDHKDFFDQIFLLLTDVTLPEKEMYWGICLPMKPQMIYGTTAFYHVLEAANEYDLQMGESGGFTNKFLHSELAYFYGFVLKRFYNFEMPGKPDFVRTVKDKQTGQARHYNISLNNIFVEVKTVAPLPVLDNNFLTKICIDGQGFQQLENILPIEMFSFSGFTVTTVTDISQQYALNNIKNHVGQQYDEKEKHEFADVIESLHELLENRNIGIHLIPIIRLYGQLMNVEEMGVKSLLTMEDLQQKYIPEPTHIFSANINEAQIIDEQITASLNALKVKGYALLPIHYNAKLMGVLELYSGIEDELNEQHLNAMEPARELLGQILNNYLSFIETNIESIIRKEYTRLQPSVQWKFTAAAWQIWMHNKKDKQQKNIPIEEISFRQVYPLYGAVDIRNSTIERNNALLQDASVQLDSLLKTLIHLKEKTEFSLLDQQIFQVNYWINLIKKSNTEFSEQEQLTDFLNQHIDSFLRAFVQSNPQYETIIQEYFTITDEKDGAAYTCRRQLENSMKLVISSVNKYFDFLKDEIQTAYPCYFEKFRTDGVEYDIYIGQSIAPEKPYHPIYLKNLRLMQLTSMAAVTKYTNALLAEMSAPLETTQLIYIHAQPIDILFRRDEKRFDVEGAYNIRYHIIKKRIDKVKLKDSNERLTQPGKIALVYYSEQEAQEYISHIRYLQADNILSNDMEKLELEELAGVRGLKALRVSVILD